MLSFLRKLPIKTQLLTLAASMMLVMLLIILVFYLKISDIYQQRNSEYMEEIMGQIRSNVSSNCEVLNNVMVNIAYNNLVQEYLMETDSSKKFLLYENVSNLIGNMQGIKEGIEDIAIIGVNGNTFDLNGGGWDTLKIIEEIPPRVNAYYYGVLEEGDGSETGNHFLIATNIYSINLNKSSNQKIGALVLFADNRALLGGKMAGAPPKTGTGIYLLDRRDSIFYSNAKEEEAAELSSIENITGNGESSFTRVINGEQCIIREDLLPEIGGRVISVISQEDLFYQVKEVRKLEIVIFIVGIVLLMIPFSFVVNNILRPMNEFMNFMKSIRSGNLKNLKVRLQLHGCVEMNVMGEEFNSMLNEIDGLTHRLVETNSKLYETELQKKQWELAGLRSQINPHFLYNTLEAVKGIAAEHGIGDIVEIVKALGAIFRYSIKGADMVSLRQEASIAKSYIRIQQIRFEGRFSVKSEFSEECLACIVPKMILQPFVENAIYHGLEMKMDEGMLTVGGCIGESGELLLWIKDNGMGMPREVLDRIRKSLDSPEASVLRQEGGSSIGISNVHHRIRLTYGEAYGVTIDSSPEKGTEVIIRIPMS